MSNLAIVVGNSTYKLQDPLDCCTNDVAAIQELLTATQKYDTITVLENLTATVLKDGIREAIDINAAIDEVFFYFTGHGDVVDGEFFFCATDYDSNRPNETGLSTELLHVLIRTADAKLVVKVVDACGSGIPLIKGERSPFADPKAPLKNLIQIASCLDSQVSFAGDPLSAFTEQFLEAATSKSDGIIYYSDILSALRDRFLDNAQQTPYFVSQGTGREQFVGDARLLDSVRPKRDTQLEKTEPHASTVNVVATTSPALTLIEKLQASDADFATQEAAQLFVDNFNGEMDNSIRSNSFGTYFSIESTTRDYYPSGASIYKFMARVLSREERPDRFVTAEIERQKKRQDILTAAAMSAMNILGGDDYYEEFIVNNNSSVTGVYSEYIFSPMFLSLQRYRLALSMAPSLTHCYIFEVLSRHLREDWGKFDPEGVVLKRRWYKIPWHSTFQFVVDQVSGNAMEQVQTYIDGLNSDPS